MIRKLLTIIILAVHLPAQNIEIEGGTLTYGEDISPDTYDPYTSTHNMANVRMMEMIFESLIGRDEVDNYTPLLAESYTINNNTITFKLKKNVLWHDNVPFTSDDVKFTYALLSYKDTPKDAYIQSIMKKIYSCTVIDKYTIQFTFNDQYKNDPLFIFEFKILPKHKIYGKRFNKMHEFTKKPVGTGPYKFYRKSDNSVILTRFDHYHSKNANLFKVKMETFNDPILKIKTLMNDGINCSVDVPRNKVIDLQTSSMYEIHDYPSFQFHYIGFNFKKPLLANSYFRAAVNLAIDKQYILEKIYLNKGKVISGPFPPASPLNNPDISPIQSDLDKALIFMQKAGLKDTDNDGIYEFNGKPVNLELAVKAGNDDLLKASAAIEQMLREAGIGVKSVFYEKYTYFQIINSQKDFDLVLGSWDFDRSSNVRPLFHSGGRYNFISYRDNEVDAYLDQISQTTNVYELQRLNWQLHKRLYIAMPYIFLWSLHKSAASHIGVQNVIIQPFFFFTHIKKWFIPREFQ